MKKRLITFVEAIKEAIDQSMQKDGNVIVFGLGVDDPKAIFGTTEGLQKKYGPDGTDYLRMARIY